MRHVHPGALVQARGAGRVLRIHAQANAALTAPVKFAKGLLQQRQPKPALPPGAAHSQRLHPAYFAAIVAQGGPGQRR